LIEVPNLQNHRPHLRRLELLPFSFEEKAALQVRLMIIGSIVKGTIFNRVLVK
jgi:hypothetical protein